MFIYKRTFTSAHLQVYISKCIITSVHLQGVHLQVYIYVHLQGVHLQMYIYVHLQGVHLQMYISVHLQVYYYKCTFTSVLLLQAYIYKL